MERSDKVVLSILCSIALVMLFAIVLYNAKASPAYADNAILLESVHPPSASSAVPDEKDEQPVPESSSAVESSPASAQQQQPDSQPVELWFNLNTVTYEQLVLINGIGDTRANAILAFRDQIGRFDSVEQLQQIKGIGEKTYQKLIQYLYVD